MATEAPGAADSGGLPQLDVSTFDNQIFWLVVALVAIYMIVTRIAVPRIGGVLSERAGTITNDIAAAEELKLKAKEAEAAYNKALADARAEAQRIVAAARAEIQADGRSTEGLDWQGALDSGMLALVREGHLAEAKERLQACLSSSSA
jgi:F-type H+-transporting ATPase subunit b